MPFDRRWLFSAAGAAFLSSLLARLEASTPTSAPAGNPRPPRAQTPDEFFALFLAGFPKAPAEVEQKELRTSLDNAYIKRFERLFKNLKEDEKLRLGEMATELGTLTYKCFVNERSGGCGWGEANPNAKLGAKHVEAARELLGFYLNLKDAKKCRGEYAVQGWRQPDESCPLCPTPF